MKVQNRALAALEQDLSLSDIEFPPDVRYVWVDEDDRLVSNVLGSFPSALHWGINWHARERRAKEKVAKEEARLIDLQRQGCDEDWLERARHSISEAQIELAAVSPTAKPPKTMVPIVIQAQRGELTAAQREVIEGSLGELIEAMDD